MVISWYFDSCDGIVFYSIRGGAAHMGDRFFLLNMKHTWLGNFRTEFGKQIRQPSRPNLKKRCCIFKKMYGCGTLSVYPGVRCNTVESIKPTRFILRVTLHKKVPSHQVFKTLFDKPSDCSLINSGFPGIACVTLLYCLCTQSPCCVRDH